VSRPLRTLAYALVLLLTLLLAVWGAFLVPFRVDGIPLPVGVLIALTNAPLCRVGGDLLGRREGAAGPLLLWAAVAFVLSTQRREGDLIVTGGLRGLAFLLVGLLAAAVAVGSWRPPPATDQPDERRQMPGGGAPRPAGRPARR
jgi:hypothetical protein